MTLPKLGTLTRYLPAPVWLGLAGLTLFAVGRCSAPGPAKPSRDSAQAARYAEALADSARVSAKRDSARNATVDSLLGDNARIRALQRQRLTTRRSEPAPPDTASQAVAYWRGRAEAAEAQLDTVLTRDSVAFDSLAGVFHVQQAEAAHLRDLLAGAADSIGRLAVKLGEKDRKLAAKGCVKLLGVPLPSLGIGAAGVIGVDGHPAYGPAVTLSWRVACVL